MVVQLWWGTVQRAPQYSLQRAEGFANKLSRLYRGLPVRPALGRLDRTEVRELDHRVQAMLLMGREVDYPSCRLHIVNFTSDR